MKLLQNIYTFLSLFTHVSVFFFSFQDLPLPRKNSRWVLLLFLSSSSLQHFPSVSRDGSPRRDDEEVASSSARSILWGYSNLAAFFGSAHFLFQSSVACREKFVLHVWIRRRWKRGEEEEEAPWRAAGVCQIVASQKEALRGAENPSVCLSYSSFWVFIHTLFCLCWIFIIHYYSTLNSNSHHFASARLHIPSPFIPSSFISSFESVSNYKSSIVPMAHWY